MKIELNQEEQDQLLCAVINYRKSLERLAKKAESEAQKAAADKVRSNIQKMADIETKLL